MIKDDFEKLDTPINDYFKSDNKELIDIYKVINDEDLKLENLRKENYDRYKSIDVSKFNDLPKDFDSVVFNINTQYSLINEEDLLIEEFEDAIGHKKTLDNIYRNINRLDRMIKTTIKEYKEENKKQEKKYNDSYFYSLNVSNEVREELIKKRYNLKLYSMIDVNDNYEALKKELIKAQIISEINQMVVMNTKEYSDNKIHKKLVDLNKKLQNLISSYNSEIDKLNSIILPNSKYFSEFTEFKNFYRKLMSYDPNNFENAKQTYEVLSDNSRFKVMLSNFNDKLKNEVIDSTSNSEDRLIEYGNSLKYIEENYLDLLSETDRKTIYKLKDKLKQGSYDIDELETKLGVIVSSIWNKSITDVYSYDGDSDFKFICTNNQFIDEKYQAILLTKEEVSKIDDYSDYQIGFICSCNSNIMYITAKKDIMEEDYKGQVNLKTPKFMEERFKNLYNCYRISLDGRKTAVIGVYYIDDGVFSKEAKAIELSNMYGLPLIIIKK